MHVRVPAATARGRTDFLARCVRGIEWVVAAEIETRLGPGTVVHEHRAVRFSTRSAPPIDALRLASADDVFLVVGEGAPVGRTRASLATLRAVACELPWAAALSELTRLRPGARWSALTVSASALGRRNYSRYEVEDAVADGVSAAVGLPYRATRTPPRDGPELSVRVHLAGDRATFALRVFDAPLHRRAYKERSCVGTLHPPLAAAMAMLAGLRPGDRVLDPCAGVGTVAIEARLLQPCARVTATDIDHDRLRDAAVNARRAGAEVVLACADGARLPWRCGAFTRVVSNVPWDRAVAARGHLGRSPGARERELARVLGETGRAVLLVDHEDPLGAGSRPAATLTLLHRSWVSVSGRHPRLCVLAREGAVERGAIDVGAPWGASLARQIGCAETVEG
jgi:23S rRNA G2445 N2-methylase RlmL